MRRCLRAHREQMRVLDSLVDDDLNDLLLESTGDSMFWLGEHPFMDEPSDAEDVEVVLRAENAALRASAADQSTMVLAAQQALECGRLQRDVENARMALEDLRSGLLRLQN